MSLAPGCHLQAPLPRKAGEGKSAAAGGVDGLPATAKGAP
jgi:hypothetical protein